MKKSTTHPEADASSSDDPGKQARHQLAVLVLEDLIPEYLAGLLDDDPETKDMVTQFIDSEPLAKAMYDRCRLARDEERTPEQWQSMADRCLAFVHTREGGGVPEVSATPASEPARTAWSLQKELAQWVEAFRDLERRGADLLDTEACEILAGVGTGLLKWLGAEREMAGTRDGSFARTAASSVSQAPARPGVSDADAFTDDCEEVASSLGRRTGSSWRIAGVAQLHFELIDVEQEGKKRIRKPALRARRPNVGAWEPFTLIGSCGSQPLRRVSSGPGDSEGGPLVWLTPVLLEDWSQMGIDRLEVSFVQDWVLMTPRLPELAFSATPRPPISPKDYFSAAAGTGRCSYTLSASLAYCHTSLLAQADSLPTVHWRQLEGVGFSRFQHLGRELSKEITMMPVMPPTTRL